MSEEKVAKTVPAATIVMLRQRKALEIFMVVRHHQIDFASGALVFPGGKADPQDFDDALIPYLDGAADDPDMRAMQVAANNISGKPCWVRLKVSALANLKTSLPPTRTNCPVACVNCP